METIAQKTLDFMLYDWLGLEALTEGVASGCEANSSELAGLRAQVRPAAGPQQ